MPTAVGILRGSTYPIQDLWGLNAARARQGHKRAVSESSSQCCRLAVGHAGQFCARASVRCVMVESLSRSVALGSSAGSLAAPASVQASVQTDNQARTYACRQATKQATMRKVAGQHIISMVCTPVRGVTWYDEYKRYVWKKTRSRSKISRIGYDD